MHRSGGPAPRPAPSPCACISADSRDGRNQRSSRCATSVPEGERTNRRLFAPRWRCFLGGEGAQIIHFVAGGLQSARFAGAVCPHYVLPLGYEHYGARLRCLAQSLITHYHVGQARSPAGSPGRPSASLPLCRVLLCPVYRSDYGYCDLLPVLGSSAHGSGEGAELYCERVLPLARIGRRHAYCRAAASKPTDVADGRPHG
jgi:hypothetical protein